MKYVIMLHGKSLSVTLDFRFFLANCIITPVYGVILCNVCILYTGSDQTTSLCTSLFISDIKSVFKDNCMGHITNPVVKSRNHRQKALFN